MPIWNTKEIAKKIQDKIGPDYSIKIHPSGGDVDTHHIQILSKKWGGRSGDGLNVCGFKLEGCFDSEDDIESEIQMVELQNLNGKVNLYKNEDLILAHTRIAFVLAGMGFEIVDDMKKYF